MSQGQRKRVAAEPAPQSRPFHGNPWRLTLAEVRVLVRLPDQHVDRVAQELEVAQSIVRTHLRKIYERMGANYITHACVYFDRWWQKWQAENPETAEIAREQLGL